MTPERREHVKRFVNDEAMAKAVHDALKRIFLKPPKTKDVQSLAAAWIAKDNFDEAWKELQQVGKGDERTPKPEGNIGV